MARIRTIKPEFWTDEKIVQLPFVARLLYIGLWNFADDDGLIVEEPERIKLQVLPGDPVDIGLLIDLLVATDRLDRLELDDGRTVLKIVNFGRHQAISHKTATKLPVAKAKKRSVTSLARRAIAQKYGCKPGERIDAQCFYCGAPGSMQWWALSNGRPSSWVSFSGLEIDHFTPEDSGGTSVGENLVLACRYCNRSKGTQEPIGFIREKHGISPELSGVLRPEGKGMEGNGREGKEGRRDEATTEPPRSAPVPPDKPAAGKGYAFDGKVIKLTSVDLERWRKSFANIRNLEAELESLDAWHSKNGTTKDWFHRVASALAKRDAEGPAARPVGGDEDPRLEDRRRWATEVQVFRSGRWDDRWPDRPKPGAAGCLWPQWLQQEELTRAKGKAA
jgi:5-methylcytosine-specific restriction endonuclease McrA